MSGAVDIQLAVDDLFFQRISLETWRKGLDRQWEDQMTERILSTQTATRANYPPPPKKAYYAMYYFAE